MRIPANKVIAFKEGKNFTGQEHRFVEAMASANIPYTYWLLPMSKFEGSDEIKTAVTDYVNNLKNNYDNGRGLIFAGPYGIGKTYALCSILKSALKANFTAYYTSISDMSMYITSKTNKEDYLSLCLKSDFLVFDEMDSRHVPKSEDGSAFFGSSIERLIRERAQNKLPTLFATNHSNLSPVFTGQYEKAITSLLAPCNKTIEALGKDFRKSNKQ
jgi:DNA replication protein DnaC